MKDVPITKADIESIIREALEPVIEDLERRLQVIEKAQTSRLVSVQKRGTMKTNADGSKSWQGTHLVD